MKQVRATFFLLFLVVAQLSFAQQKTSDVVNAIVKEGTQNSQLETLAHELTDGIGPRLIGSPKMKQANDWAVKKYSDWGISARNEKWGEWRGWDRGISHIDMTSPWVKSLAGQQLAWSPSTNGKTINAEAIVIPNVKDSIEFAKWLPAVKGKFVMISMLEPTGRPTDNWKEWGTAESIAKMNETKASASAEWRKRIANTGFSSRTLPEALEKAGAAGIITSYWSSAFGANKIFSASTKKIPTVDLSLEDYGLVFRLAESGRAPKLNIIADSKETGVQPTFNTLAEIKGSEKPNEYVMLSAHFDSWDGATGATDNATGTITMMEAMRILKKIYPNPKRTILVGHWSSEEQGLNGSRAFVEDHPEIVKNIQALFNQDNGTGRVVNLSGQGFLNSYDYLGRWLTAVPKNIRDNIETNFPGTPGGGGSDYASFVAAGAPAFSLSSNSWSYGSVTWHTNLDTYDKIVFDDVRNNAILTAILVYMASEDPETTSRVRSVLPVNSRTGEPGKWPEQRSPTRRGGLN